MTILLKKSTLPIVFILLVLLAVNPTAVGAEENRLYVGGIDLLSADSEEYPKGVSFDKETNTLSLHNASLTEGEYNLADGGSATVFYSSANKEPLNITVTGENRISNPASPAIGYGIYSDSKIIISNEQTGELTVSCICPSEVLEEKGNTVKVSGIVAEELSVTKEAVLTVEEYSGNNLADGVIIIHNTMLIDENASFNAYNHIGNAPAVNAGTFVSNGTVDVVGNIDIWNSNYAAVIVAGDFILNSGSFHAVPDSCILGTEAAQMINCSGTMKIKGGELIIDGRGVKGTYVEGMNGISADSFEMTDGYVFLYGTKYFDGLNAGSVTISGGTLEAPAGEEYGAGGITCGTFLCSDGDVKAAKIDAYEFTASGTAKLDISRDINAWASFTMKENADIDIRTDHYCALSAGNFGTSAAVNIEGGKLNAVSRGDTGATAGLFIWGKLNISGGIIHAKGDYGVTLIDNDDVSDDAGLNITGGYTVFDGKKAAVYWKLNSDVSLNELVKITVDSNPNGVYPLKGRTEITVGEDSYTVMCGALVDRDTTELLIEEEKPANGVKKVVFGTKPQAAKDVILNAGVVPIGNGENQFEVSLIGGTEKGCVIIALYNENMLVDVKKASYDGDDICFTSSAVYDQARVFLLDSADTLIPLIPLTDIN